MAKSEEGHKIDFYQRTHQGTYVQPLNEEISFVGSANTANPQSFNILWNNGSYIRQSKLWQNSMHRL